MFRSSAAVVALAAVAAVTTGCQRSGDEPPSSAPTGATGGPTISAGPTAGDPPTSAAGPTATPAGSAIPTASPSLLLHAANTAVVCQAVDTLIVDGSRRITRDSAEATRRQLTPEQLNGQLAGTLADLADDVRGQADRATDPRIRKLIAGVAGRLDAGAEADSPATWMQTGLVDLPRRLNRDCHV
ncbi:hypothetical protein ACFY3U_25375 [Micromonospora sp. NPDC000089]|uniref:hypothetical protein n=1 Tax=unclassified Micromonospora TaxID=2617518 RepID=UPI003682C1D3